MTVQRFFEAVEGYYGAKYNQVQAQIVRQYLSGKADRALDHLFSAVLRTFSSQFGKLPDIAIFEGLRKEVIEALHSEAPPVDLRIEEQPISDAEREAVSRIIAEWRKQPSWAIAEKIGLGDYEKGFTDAPQS